MPVSEINGSQEEDSHPFASVGSPLLGAELRIVEGDVSRIERILGEIEVRAPYVTSGYWDVPEESLSLFNDGWLRTGDIGYLADRELFITGRMKDAIKYGGQTVAPEIIESIAASATGRSKGRFMAFSVSDRGPVVMLVEDEPGREPPETRRQVALAVRAEMDMAVEVVVVEEGSLPKTTSGKLQRRRGLEAYESGALNAIG